MQHTWCREEYCVSSSVYFLGQCRQYRVYKIQSLFFRAGVFCVNILKIVSQQLVLMGSQFKLWPHIICTQCYSTYEWFQIVFNLHLLSKFFFMFKIDTEIKRSKRMNQILAYYNSAVQFLKLSPTSRTMKHSWGREV